jgi:hypothetical protein
VIGDDVALIAVNHMPAWHDAEVVTTWLGYSSLKMTG